MKLQLILGASLLGVTAFGQAFTETFDDLVDANGNTNLSGLYGRGWDVKNQSTPVGLTAWYGGETSYMAQDQSSETNTVNAGSNIGYIAANYNNTSTSGTGTISDFLFSPTTSLHNGDTFSFETISDGYAPDNLELLLSTAGSSESASDFSHVLLQINPTLSPTGYATTWTKYTVTLSGLSGTGLTGKFALHYAVPNAGLFGVNSSYIGVDNVVYTPNPAPEPASLAALAIGAVSVLRRRRNRA